MPTEDDIYQIIAALGTGGPLECHRVAKGVRELLEGKSVDDVLRDDLQKAS